MSERTTGNDIEPVPVEVLETRAIDILETLVDAAYDELRYFPDTSRSNIVDVWERVTGIHGGFDGITATDTDPDVTTEEDRRAVIVHFELDGRPFKTRTEFHENGEVTGFWILKGEDTSVLDVVSDTRRLVQQEAVSKMNAVFSLLTVDDPLDGTAEPVDDDERRVVEAIIDEFEDEAFDRVYDRLAPDIRADVSPAELGSVWNDAVTSYEGIDTVAKRDGVIEVAIQDTDGTRAVILSLTEDGTVDAFRIDGPG